MNRVLSFLLPMAALGALTLTVLPGTAQAGGAEDFATYCTACHGDAGKGDGAAAAALDPKPADLSTSKLSNDELTKIIKEGGEAVGRSPLMTAWGPVLDDAKIADVVKFIGGLKAK